MPDGGRLWKKTLGDALTPGDVIAGKYRLDRVLGAGGMGVVLEAHHIELEARVAVKLLRIDQESDAAHARFLREARSAFQITSEHVARILDLGSHEDAGLYMVMEFLDGRDLSQMMVRRGRLPIGTAVGYILQVCEAVAEAHSLGIVHRDLKPENIFVCRRADGTPCAKVIDFGLAKVENRVQSLTGMNRGLGTPRYMSPEQWVSARDVGGAADIWALGVILFELVTGKTPFPDDDINELCQAIIAGEAPRASEAEPDVPKGIDDIIAKCLQKKPAARYASAAELAGALLPFAQLSSVSTVSGTMRPPAPAPMWIMSQTDVRDPEVTREVVPPAIHTDDATTVDNVEIGRAFERVGDDGPPTTRRRDSSAEWVASPIATPQQERRSPWMRIGAAGVSLAAGALLFVAMGDDAPPPRSDAATESPVADAPRARPTLLEPLEPPVAPPPAPLELSPPPEPIEPPTALDPIEPSPAPPGEALSEPAEGDPPSDAAPEPEASVAPAPPPPRWRPPVRRQKKSEWKPPDDL